MLKPATNESAFLKAGIMGFAGTGKTHTATKLAIGLSKYIDSKKPIAFLDTETGSDFVLPQFKENGIELLTEKSRAFVQLLATIKESEKLCDILIIDSITHFWEELVNAYMKKLDRKKLRIWDWGPIKMEWRQFTELYLNSKLHIIMNGRSGWTYSEREDDEGVLETAKTGTKMKVETDMGYEPRLLIEMEKVSPGDGRIGQKFLNRAWVLKDCFDRINGKFFDNPKFDDFLPHIKLLNIGGVHSGVDVNSSSVDLFDAPDSRNQWHKRREIALENIQNEMLKRWPTQSVLDKKTKISVLEKMFNTASWAAISERGAEELEGAVLMLKEMPLIENIGE